MTEVPRLVIAQIEARTSRLEKELTKSTALTLRKFDEMTAGSTRASKRISRDMDKAASSIDKAFGSLKGFATGFAGGLAAGVIGEFTGAIEGAVKGIADLKAQAQQAGVGVEGFQRLNVAARHARVGTDALVDGLKELQLRGAEFALTGKGSAADALTRLGYTADQLKAKLRDPSALFLEVIGRLQQLDTSARILNLDELFGGTGAEQFIRLVDMGADKIQRVGDEAKASGAIIETELVDRAALLAAQWDLIATVIKGNLVSAILSASSAMGPLIAQSNALGNSFSRFMNDPNWLNFNAFMLGGNVELLAQKRALPGPADDARENARARTFSAGTAAPVVSEDRATRARASDGPPISQTNLPPIPYRPPNLLDYDPNPVARGGGGGGSRAASAGAARSEADAVEALISSLEEELALVGKTDAERAVATNLRQAGASATEQQKAKIRELTAAIEQQEAAQKSANQAQQAFKGVATDAVRGLIDDLRNGASAADALSGALDRVIDKLLDQAFDKLSGGFNLTSILGSIALGAPAAGGVYAEGGDIRGPGTGTSDSIPIWASNGEFIVNAKATAKHRALLHAINSGSSLFATGGIYGTPETAVPTSVGARPGGAVPPQSIQISAPITVNGSSGSPEQNQDLANRMRKEMESTVRGVVADELRRQMRPGNMVNRRS